MEAEDRVIPVGDIKTTAPVVDELSAFESELKAAEAGDAAAQFAVGTRFEKGQATVQNPQKAVFYFEKAAAQGHAAAQFAFASCLSRGHGIEKDEKRAFELYRKAADQGFVRAMFNLATCYESGFGTDKDVQLAVQWFVKAQGRGHPAATLRLAMLRGSERPDLLRRGQTPLIDASQLLPPFFKLAGTHTLEQLRCSYEEGGAVRDVTVSIPHDSGFASSAAFLNEWLAITSVPEHPNIFRFLGLCQNLTYEGRQQPISFVHESCGYLQDYLEKNPGHGHKYFVQWAIDIARALAHVHANDWLHRMVAVFSVYLAPGFRIVLGNFSIACPRYGAPLCETDSYPVDTDPQTILDPSKYTIESDVFGLGLLLFDIATECKYSDQGAFDFNDTDAIDNPPVMVANIKREAAAGYPTLVARMPSTIPRAFIDIMLSCLAFEPKDRPTTAGIVAEMKRLLLLLV